MLARRQRLSRAMPIQGWSTLAVVASRPRISPVETSRKNGQRTPYWLERSKWRRIFSSNPRFSWWTSNSSCQLQIRHRSALAQLTPRSLPALLLLLPISLQILLAEFQGPLVLLRQWLLDLRGGLLPHSQLGDVRSRRVRRNDLLGLGCTRDGVVGGYRRSGFEVLCLVVG